MLRKFFFPTPPALSVYLWPQTFFSFLPRRLVVDIQLPGPLVLETKQLDYPIRLCLHISSMYRRVDKQQKKVCLQKNTKYAIYMCLVVIVRTPTDLPVVGVLAILSNPISPTITSG